jgi:hypothetical protein
MCAVISFALRGRRTFCYTVALTISLPRNQLHRDTFLKYVTYYLYLTAAVCILVCRFLQCVTYYITRYKAAAQSKNYPHFKRSQGRKMLSLHPLVTF